MTSSKSLAKKTHSEQWWATAPKTVIRCSAIYTTTGTPCRREAHPGAGVCWEHGARMPVVRDAAARRLGDSLEDAANNLVAWMNDPSIDMRERVKIAMDILNRGGLGEIKKVLIGVGDESDPIESLFRAILTEGMGAAPTQREEPWPFNQAVLDDPEYDAPRVIKGEVVTPRQLMPPAHTVDTGPVDPTPKHIREDIERAMRELI